jgi:hypothetical protein
MQRRWNESCCRTIIECVHAKKMQTLPLSSWWFCTYLLSAVNRRALGGAVLGERPLWRGAMWHKRSDASRPFTAASCGASGGSGGGDLHREHPRQAPSPAANTAMAQAPIELRRSERWGRHLHKMRGGAPARRVESVKPRHLACSSRAAISRCNPQLPLGLERWGKTHFPIPLYKHGIQSILPLISLTQPLFPTSQMSPKC